MATHDQLSQHGCFGLEDAVADSVDWKDRSRAVPEAVATCLWSGMFLSWPGASRSCFFPL